ncbi:MAG: ABC transporter substrate-binding protein [Candidatus Limivicinus sp.]
MKKILALVLCLAMVFALCACGGSSAPAESAAPAEESAAPAEESAAVAGKVYYLNFKPEADAAWQDLAKLYTEQTGVPVKVVTAASGTYSDTLTAEMGKTEAPTLFQCGNAQGLADWNDYCLDFTGTAVLDEMTTSDFNLTDDTGAVKAIGYCYEAFGIIVNKALLEQAGYSLADITNFDSLKAVADDIHARADELGFDAFSSSGLDSSSSWRFSGHLANMPLYYEFRDDGVTEQPAEITGAYLDNFRAIWDLYINDSAADKTSLTTATSEMSSGEFKEGKAVFYQNGTWEYSGLVDAGLNPDDLAMIPIYCGVDGEEDAGLCCGTENCWAVNAKASEEDIKATLDFIYWVVTSDEGTQMMAEQFGPIPFKNAKESENVFFNDANAYMADGKYTVTWAFNHTPNVDSWRATVVTALAAYSADQSDANWDAVVEAFVDGWAYEYNVQNG